MSTPIEEDKLTEYKYRDFKVMKMGATVEIIGVKDCTHEVIKDESFIMIDTLRR